MERDLSESPKRGGYKDDLEELNFRQIRFRDLTMRLVYIHDLWTELRQEPHLRIQRPKEHDLLLIQLKILKELKQILLSMPDLMQGQPSSINLSADKLD